MMDRLPQRRKHTCVTILQSGPLQLFVGALHCYVILTRSVANTQHYLCDMLLARTFPWGVRMGVNDEQNGREQWKSHGVTVSTTDELISVGRRRLYATTPAVSQQGNRTARPPSMCTPHAPIIPKSE